jgi:hypothetical protein
MGALLEALSEYIDFLVLGAVAVAALCAPFGPSPLVKVWTYLGAPEKDGAGAQEKDSTGTPEKDSNISIRVGLIAGALFALLYFSGYFLNAIGATFVYPAHVGIVDTVASSDPNDSSNAELKPVVIKRLFPVFGPFRSRPQQSELKNYWRDASRQIFWQVCDQKSADSLLGGGILKELRLLRGAIGLTQILLPLCLLVALWNLPGVLRNLLAAWRNGDRGRRLVWPLSGLAWPLGTFGAVLGAYYLLIIPSYTLVEYDNHITVWVTFPGKLDEGASKIDIAKIDDLLPCRKMKIVADQSKSKEGTAGEGSSLPPNPPKKQ